MEFIDQIIELKIKNVFILMLPTLKLYYHYPKLQ